MPDACLPRTADRRLWVISLALLTAVALVLPVRLPAAAAATPTAVPQTNTAAAAAKAKKAKKAKRAKRARRLAAEVLDRVNAARAHGRYCGSTYYRAAPPLRADRRLAVAAARHARDMAYHRYFSHSGRNGSSPTDRARHAGYRSGAGENIAAGYGTPSRTMSAWLASPGHCSNIMSRSYRAIGVGYAAHSGSPYHDYWVQDFGLR